MRMTPSSQRTGQRLGQLLLAYLGAVVLVIVLAPFRFAVPGALTGALVEGEAWWVDALLNVVLFVPLGFIGYRTADGIWRGRTVLLGAALFSSALECTQLFIPERYTTASGRTQDDSSATLLLEHPA